MEEVKYCKCCGEEKSKTEFYKDAKRKDNLQIYCKTCTQVKASVYYKNNRDKEKTRKRKWVEDNPVLSVWFRIKERAFRKNIDFNIEVSDLVIPDVCPVLKIKLERGKEGKQANSPSVDRIDNTKGYLKGNVQVISDLANSMKRDATPEQLLLFADWVYNTYKK